MTSKGGVGRLGAQGARDLVASGFRVLGSRALCSNPKPEKKKKNLLQPAWKGTPGHVQVFTQQEVPRPSVSKPEALDPKHPTSGSQADCEGQKG